MLSSVFCFSGNEYLVLQKIRIWKQSFLKKHESELNIIEMNYVREDDIATIINEIESLPFLSPFKLIFIRGVLDTKGRTDETKEVSDKNNVYQRLLESCEQAPKTSIIVFVSPKPNKRTVLYKKLLPKNCKEFTVNDSFMVEGFDDTGKTFRLSELFLPKYKDSFSRDSLEYLIYALIPNGSDREEVNIFLIENELDKLSHYTGGAMVHHDDIDRVVPKAIAVKIYEFTEHMGFGRVAKAVQSMEELLEQGEDIYGLWGNIMAHFRKLLMLSAFVQEGIPKAEMKNYLGRAAFTIDKMMLQVKKFPIEKLQHIYTMLLEIDIKLKTGGIYITTTDQTAFQLALEKFIIRASSIGN